MMREHILFLMLPLMALILGGSVPVAAEDVESIPVVSSGTETGHDDEPTEIIVTTDSELTDPKPSQKENRGIYTYEEEIHIMQEMGNRMLRSLSGGGRNTYPRTRSDFGTSMGSSKDLESAWRLVEELHPINTETIKPLIKCESGGWNDPGHWDVTGYAYGCLQFHRPTWNRFSRESGIEGDPLSCRDSIKLADWAISHDYLNHWTCASSLGLLDTVPKYFERRSLPLGSTVIVPADEASTLDAEHKDSGENSGFVRIVVKGADDE